MSILFLANNILAPSQPWMRRFVDAVGPRIVALCDSALEAPSSYGNHQIISISDAEPMLWRRALGRAGVPVEQLPRATAIHKLSAVLRASRPSIVIVQFLNEAVRFARPLALYGCPVFVHCHGWDVTWNMHDHATGRRRMHPADYESQVRALPEQFRFLANSEGTKCRLLSLGIPAARIDVLYFGVPIAKSCPDPPGAGNILFLGRLVDFKAPDLVISAFEIAATRGLDANLIVAGDGPLRTTCELLRARSPFAGRIHLIGAVDERRGEELRREASIFTAHSCIGALTRQAEAYGVAFIEAMASGLPVVTGRSGGITETVRDGEDGILFEPGDVEAHANALLRLYADRELRHQMGRSAWRRVADCFSQEAEAKSIFELLDRWTSCRSVTLGVG